MRNAILGWPRSKLGRIERPEGLQLIKEVVVQQDDTDRTSWGSTIYEKTPLTFDIPDMRVIKFFGTGFKSSDANNAVMYAGFNRDGATNYITVMAGSTFTEGAWRCARVTGQSHGWMTDWEATIHRPWAFRKYYLAATSRGHNYDQSAGVAWFSGLTYIGAYERLTRIDFGVYQGALIAGARLAMYGIP